MIYVTGDQNLILKKNIIFTTTLQVIPESPSPPSTDRETKHCLPEIVKKIVRECTCHPVTWEENR